MTTRADTITHALGRKGDVGEFTASGTTACALPSCRQADFLPFPCAHCHSQFCLSHARPAAHACAAAGVQDHAVFVCPLCKHGIDVVPGEDINATFARHEATPACRAARKAPAKPRCAAKGCREVLQSHTAFACKACLAKFCVTHRTDLSHACAGPPRPANGLSRLLGGGGGGGGGGVARGAGAAPAAPAARPVAKLAPIKAPDHVRDTADRRKRGPGEGGGGGSSGGASPSSPCNVS